MHAALTGQPHELTPHSAQLEEFLSLMRTALRPVTSLDITLSVCTNKGPLHQRNMTTHHIRGSLGQEAGSEFALLLTNACPTVHELGMSGGFGDGALQLFGSQWQQLTTLNILQGSMCVQLFRQPGCDVLFPSVTHMRIVDTHLYEADFQDIRLYTALTHLEVENGWLQDRWCMLPASLQILRCSDIPHSFPSEFRLNRLEVIHVTNRNKVSLNVKTLAALLRIAPALRLLVTLQGVWRTITIKSCAPSVLRDIQLVSQRISTGFTLQGVEMLDSDYDLLPPPAPRYGIDGRPRGLCEEVACRFPNALDLGRAPVVYTFDSCNFNPLVRDGRGADCLAMLSHTFPDLKRLSLGMLMTMSWQDASLSEPLSFTFRNVTSLNSEDCMASSTALLHLVACMPKLDKLAHFGKMVGDEVVAFQAKLCATQMFDTVESAGNSQSVRDWTLQSSEFGRFVWARGVKESGLPLLEHEV